MGRKFQFDNPDDALRALAQKLIPTAVERIADDFTGRILAADVVAVTPDPATVPRAPAEDACTFAYPGDANCDRVFDSSDLVLVMQSAEYEDGVEDNSDWRDGDFDGDGDFTSSDLVMAFQTGYEPQIDARDDPRCDLHQRRLPLFGGLLVFFHGRSIDDAYEDRFAGSDELLDILARCRSQVSEGQSDV